MTTAAHKHDDHGNGHGAGGHPRFLAHHFDTPQQQFDSGKLGIWLFLTTEVLLFSGLFCAYAVYRATHPQVFEFAHLYLDKTMGAVNTVVLIFSSFTMAWAVRCAQTGEQQKLKVLLAITILCGAAFMVVKYIEYKAKFEHGTLWGQKYAPHDAPYPEAHTAATAPAAIVPGTETQPTPVGLGEDGRQIDKFKFMRAPVGDSSVSTDWENKQSPAAPVKTEDHGHRVPEPANTQLFFSIYFLMTGLHGIHVLAGMAVIGWVLWRAQKGHFGPDYFNPVDFVGLYWHVVDLVWIFLFPLLYLIA
jgi:cytochrome c oxidase subunit 3